MVYKEEKTQQLSKGLKFKFHSCLHLIFLAKFANANKIIILFNSLADDHFKQGLKYKTK